MPKYCSFCDKRIPFTRFCRGLKIFLHVQKVLEKISYPAGGLPLWVTLKMPTPLCDKYYVTTIV